MIRADWSGFLSEVRVRDGDTVSEGQVLAVITNEELDFTLLTLRHQIRAVEARHRMLETTYQAAAQAEAERLRLLREDMALLEERKASLTVRAPFDGQVIAPGLERVDGRFLQLGDPIFTVASLGKVRLLAVVSGTDVQAVWETRDKPVRVKLASAPGRVFMGRIDPERELSSATHAPPPPALTNAGGGDILLDPKSPEGQRTLLPWFRVDIVLDNADVRLPVGVTGTIRFVIGRDPIGTQAWLRFRRMLHRRFLI